MATMRNHAWLLAVVALVAARGSRALQLSVRPAPAKTTAAANNNGINMSWGGLFAGVMGRAATNPKGGNDVLTPKSRVKLGDLSVSPMGELCLIGIVAQRW